MKNNYENDIFIQDLKAIKEYFETIKDRMTNTRGIFDLIMLEKLIKFIAPERAIDIEMLNKTKIEINYINGLIHTYKVADIKDKKMMVKKIGPELSRRATAMSGYLTHVKNSMLDAILNNYMPFAIDVEAARKSDEDLKIFVDKDAKTKENDIDETIKRFNQITNAYTGEQYSLK